VKESMLDEIDFLLRNTNILLSMCLLADMGFLLADLVILLADLIILLADFRFLLANAIFLSQIDAKILLEMKKQEKNSPAFYGMN
jgi:hypothetical protein